MASFLDIVHPNLSRQLLENKARRQGLADRKRKREATAELRGLLSEQTPTGAPPAGSPSGSPAISPEMFGLFGEIAPNVLANSLLGQPQQQARAEPSQVRIARILADPNEPESVKENIRLQLEKNGNTTEQQLQQLDFQRTMFEIQELLRKNSEEATTRDQKKRRTAFDIQSSLEDAASLSKSLDILDDTSQRTGVPMPDIRRSAAGGLAALTSLLGRDSGDMQKVIDAVDTFKKTSARFAAKTATRLFGKNITNSQLESVQAFSPSMSLSPNANRQIISSTISDLMNEAQIREVSIDTQRFQGLANELRNPGSSSLVDKIPGFKEMSAQQQDELRQGLARLTPSERAVMLRKFGR